ncbi:MULTISPECIES: NAD(P)/FAD-dependent oxidoreductase [Klebsiella]|jgi:glycine/D-amino acid oxidase-like deaminating enzyme|uniref:NAD(P)/FAD-dependent oxidoreductase n=1 Tax=Klebsiella TaxID=570 RepID=UPI000ABB0C5D|nr:MULTISPECIES: FAD-binding oxidoreductase [Klebsiella]MDT9831349.1 FAD-binding oxidoreductase [Klebsiella pneumoniae]
MNKLVFKAGLWEASVNISGRKVVIVGAGIVGASIAWHLSRQGHIVTVVDKDLPASGATGSAFGWITCAVSENAPDALLRKTAAADWHRLESEIPELDINWSGSLSYSEIPQVVLPGEIRLKQPAIRCLEPALACPPCEARLAEKDGAVNAAEATRILLARACALGAVLKIRTMVSGFCYKEGVVKGVMTSEGRLAADHVVLACGTGIPGLTSGQADRRIPVRASPAVLMRFAAPEKLVKTLIAGDDIEVRHARNGDLLAAEDFPVKGCLQETVISTLTAIKNGLKGAESVSLIGYSTRLRPIPEDGKPVIGFTDQSQRVYIAVMHPAVTCAATIGRLVSEEISDGTNAQIPEHWRPSRFFTSHNDCQKNSK